jgi:CheY-like chemotaxis protein
MASKYKATVLVVDDEALVRMDLADMLASAGCRTLEACCAVDAIHILEHDPDISAVFTDIQMPGCMDGLALAHYVREHWPTTIIVISSGNRTPPQSDMPAETNFMSKPFGVVDLDKILEQLN